MRVRMVCLFIPLLMLFSCFQPQAQNGTLTFRTVMNEELSKGTSTDSCLVVDLKWRFESFEVSTGRIVAGAPDTLEWVSVYSDTSESYLTEFDFETELEPGTYRTIRLSMRNRNYWVVEWGDSLLEVEDWNRDSTLYEAEEASYSYYDFRGCWYCDNDEFENVAPDESTSDILILNGSTVDITMNWNLYMISFARKPGSNNMIATDWFIREGYDMIEWDISGQ